MLELSIYEDIPHLLTPVVDPKSSICTQVGRKKMENRYKLMSSSAKNIDSYNENFETISSGGKLFREVQTRSMMIPKCQLLKNKNSSRENAFYSRSN